MYNKYSTATNGTVFISMIEIRKKHPAAVETIAEGFVDGYLTPMFFYAFFGIAGAMVARVINTMDSNIAYRDNTHYEFGRCTAIGDSITNFISSRMAPFMFSISAFLLGIKYAKTRIINIDNSEKNKQYCIFSYV